MQQYGFVCVTLCCHLGCREWNRKNILEIKERQIRSKAQQELVNFSPSTGKATPDSESL